MGDGWGATASKVLREPNRLPADYSLMAPLVLISGIGIAGPTLAYWLNRYGFCCTLVEKSPSLRTGGYVIDFWGLVTISLPWAST